MFISKELFFKKILFMQKNSVPYNLFFTTNTYYLKSGLGNFFSSCNKKMNMRGLNFIKRVKNHVLDNEIYKKIINDVPKNTKKIRYFNYQDLINDREYTENVYEVDINQAYWEVAYKEGIINKELYNEGLGLKKELKEQGKIIRLAALGSLAKKTSLWEFDGKKEIYLGEETDERLNFLWFKICNTMGLLMEKVKNENLDKFLFFWVDGIYVLGEETAKTILKRFNELGYQSKVRPIHRVRFAHSLNKLLVFDTKEAYERYLKGIIKDNKGYRPFPLPDKNKK